MSLIDIIKAKVVINEIKKQDPQKLGILIADFIDGALDDSCKRSEEIQRVLIPFLNKLSMSITKRLLEN